MQLLNVGVTAQNNRKFYWGESLDIAINNSHDILVTVIPAATCGRSSQFKVLSEVLKVMNNSVFVHLMDFSE